MSDKSYEQSLNAFNEAYSALCTRSMQDDAFRAKAKSDPVGAWRDVTGRDLPAGLAVKFVEPHEGAHFILPIPACDDGELSDASLASIAGGKGGVKGSV